jgi:hypothetical protein
VRLGLLEFCPLSLLPSVPCFGSRVRQFERNLGIKADTESLIAKLRVRPHDDYCPACGAIKFTSSQSRQKLYRCRVVQIPNRRFPYAHNYRITTARICGLRDQQCRKAMGAFGVTATTAQPLKLYPLTSGARDVELKLTVADDDCAARWLLSARKQPPPQSGTFME